MAFDTLECYTKLTATGIPEEQARVHTYAIYEILVTKGHTFDAPGYIENQKTAGMTEAQANCLADMLQDLACHFKQRAA